MNNPLVSIIIPTYNRAHLIGETLDSILAQTYKNWECIIVDDGSTDNSAEVIGDYVRKDSRFQYHKRPESHKPGGNGARNYGFEVSKGEYINWFDSDDIMLKDKISIESEALTKYSVDFIVSKRKYFNHKNNSFFNYDFKTEDVSFESFAIDYISWHTPDLMVKRKVIEGKVKFNEQMTAGQEYNFNCKLLLITNKLYYTDKFLTLRRFSKDSIQGKRDLDSSIHQKKLFESHWLNYMDIKMLANSPKFNRYSLLQCVQSYFQIGNAIQLPKNFGKELRKVFPRRFIWFYAGLLSKKIHGGNYFFYQLLKNKEVFNTYKSKKN